jgi:hypothetical protein
MWSVDACRLKVRPNKYNFVAAPWSNASINPFIFIKNKQLLISSEGFYALDNKNAGICSQRAMLPIQSHPTRSLSRIVCRGREGPKGSKGTLRPDFQANTRPRMFFLKPVSPYNKAVDKEMQVWLA